MPIAEGPSQFAFLAFTRLQEAYVLLESGHRLGAVYIGGYVIECAMKAVIAKVHRGKLPSHYEIHDLAVLRRAILPRLRGQHVAIVQSIPAWSHLYRYETTQPSARTAISFLERAKETYRCLSTYL